MFIGGRKSVNPNKYLYYSSSSVLFPSVNRLAIEYNIDTAQLKGSGKNNRLLKGDVLNYIKSKNLVMASRAIQWPVQESVYTKQCSSNI